MFHPCLKLALFFVLVTTQSAHADLNAVLNASCRIVSYNDEKDSGTGTGIVYAEDSERLLVLSAGHVIVDKDLKLRKLTTVEFFGTGHRSGAFTGKVIWHRYTVGTYTDLAILEVKKSLFGKYPIPKPVPFIQEDHELKGGDTIISCGSPEGMWPCLWRGHIDSADDSGMRFQPFPAGGRSGSAVLDAEGNKIMGIIIWNDRNQNQGVAISHKTIYVLTGWNKKK